MTELPETGDYQVVIEKDKYTSTAYFRDRDQALRYFRKPRSGKSKVLLDGKIVEI